MNVDRKSFAEQLEATSVPSNLSPENQQKAIDSLLQYVQSILPRGIFRFRSCSELSFSAFDKDELWVSTADCMNDGYDTRIFVDAKEVNEQFNSILTNYTDKTKFLNSIPDLSGFPDQFIQGKKQIQALSEDELRKMLQNTLDWIITDTAFALQQLPAIGQQTAKFCCFSENIQSSYMWGIYAQDESGFALEYDFTQLPYATSPNEYFSRDCALFPVIYGEERYKIPTEYVVFLLQYRLIHSALAHSGLFQNNPSFAMGLLNSGVCPDNLMVTKISLHKSKEWEKESEWRLFCSSVNDAEFQNAKHGCCIKKPSALYLGRRIKPINEKILRKIAEEKEIPVYKMILDNDSPSYELQIL